MYPGTLSLENVKNCSVLHIWPSGSKIAKYGQPGDLQIQFFVDKSNNYKHALMIPIPIIIFLKKKISESSGKKNRDDILEKVTF